MFFPCQSEEQHHDNTYQLINLIYLKKTISALADVPCDFVAGCEECVSVH